MIKMTSPSRQEIGGIIHKSLNRNWFKTPTISWNKHLSSKEAPLKIIVVNDLLDDLVGREAADMKNLTINHCYNTYTIVKKERAWVLP